MHLRTNIEFNIYRELWVLWITMVCAFKHFKIRCKSALFIFQTRNFMFRLLNQRHTVLDQKSCGVKSEACLDHPEGGDSVIIQKIGPCILMLLWLINLISSFKVKARQRLCLLRSKMMLWILVKSWKLWPEWLPWSTCMAPMCAVIDSIFLCAEHAGPAVTQVLKT